VAGPSKSTFLVTEQAVAESPKSRHAMTNHFLQFSSPRVPQNGNRKRWMLMRSESTFPVRSQSCRVVASDRKQLSF
jgi:hypothetical protein